MLRGNELKRVLRNAKVNREEKKSAFSSSFFFFIAFASQKKKRKNIGKRGKKKRLSAYTCTYLREVKRHIHFFFSLFSAVAIAYVCVLKHVHFFFLFYGGRMSELKKRKAGV